LKRLLHSIGQPTSASILPLPMCGTLTEHACTG